MAQWTIGRTRVAQNADGRLEFFTLSTDGALWHIWQMDPGGVWSDWNSLGRAIGAEPVVFQNADGRLEVFVWGTDNALWHIWQMVPNSGYSGWSNWASLGGV